MKNPDTEIVELAERARLKAQEELRELQAFMASRDFAQVEKDTSGTLAWIYTVVSIESPELLLLVPQIIDISRTAFAYGYWKGYQARGEEDFKPEFTEV